MIATPAASPTRRPSLFQTGVAKRWSKAVSVIFLKTIWRIADGLNTRPSELLARAERILDEGPDDDR